MVGGGGLLAKAQRKEGREEIRESDGHCKRRKTDGGETSALLFPLCGLIWGAALGLGIRPVEPTTAFHLYLARYV